LGQKYSTFSQNRPKIAVLGTREPERPAIANVRHRKSGRKREKYNQAYIVNKTN